MREEKRAYWSKLIAEQEASGATIPAFCKQRGIGYHSLYFWRRRLRGPAPVQFALLKTMAGGGAPIELYLNGGERLCIANGADAATLRSVIAALRS